MKHYASILRCQFDLPRIPEIRADDASRLIENSDRALLFVAPNRASSPKLAGPEPPVWLVSNGWPVCPRQPRFRVNRARKSALDNAPQALPAQAYRRVSVRRAGALERAGFGRLAGAPAFFLLSLERPQLEPHGGGARASRSAKAALWCFASVPGLTGNFRCGSDLTRSRSLRRMTGFCANATFVSDRCRRETDIADRGCGRARNGLIGIAFGRAGARQRVHSCAPPRLIQCRRLDRRAKFRTQRQPLGPTDEVGGQSTIDDEIVPIHEGCAIAR